MSSTKPTPIRIGGTRIDVQNLELRPGLTLDEVQLEGEGVLIAPPASDSDTVRVECGETRFRAMMSEQNLNRLIEFVLPADAAVKDVRIALMSGKARLSLQTSRLVSLPISLEAVPRVENGVRIVLDWKSVTMAGMPVPRQLMEAFEDRLQKLLSLDLSISPVPVWVDEIRCEPGRLIAVGTVQIAWPPPVVKLAARPFTATDSPLDLDASQKPAEIIS